MNENEKPAQTLPDAQAGGITTVYAPLIPFSFSKTDFITGQEEKQSGISPKNEEDGIPYPDLLADGYTPTEINLALKYCQDAGLTVDPIGLRVIIKGWRKDQKELQNAKSEGKAAVDKISYIRNANHAVETAGLMERLVIDCTGQEPKFHKIRCIWHEDSTPSLHIYPNGVYCHGCQRYEDPVGFWADTHGISNQYEAAIQVNDRYHLGVRVPEFQKNRGRPRKKATVAPTKNQQSNISDQKQQEQEFPKPTDFSDVGQARVFAAAYHDKVFFNHLSHSDSNSWFAYNGEIWQPSAAVARKYAQELTDLQLSQARAELLAARQAKDAATEAGQDDERDAASMAEKTAEKYRNFVLGQRKTTRIAACLTESKPLLIGDITALDSNPYLLNVPAGTIDLSTGEMHEHRASDMLSKITRFSPSQKGMDEWQKHLSTVTGEDGYLQNYLQQLFGSFLIGSVSIEQLSIVTGPPGCGKSTTINAIMAACGTYSGELSADTFWAENQRNILPGVSKLQGCRIVLSPEMKPGQTLHTGMVKILTSNDRIVAEPKYCDPFSFKPTHHILLTCNQLPEIKSNDPAVWDKIQVIPFQTQLRWTNEEIKGYTEKLVNNCGEAILEWLLDGCQMFLKLDGKIEVPDAVKNITAEYRKKSDWLFPFIQKHCERSPSGRVLSSRVLEVYAAFCNENGVEMQNETIFKAEMSRHGFIAKRESKGVTYRNLRLINVE